jgi:hypothetical protein
MIVHMRLTIAWSGVQIPLGPPYLRKLGFFLGHFWATFESVLTGKGPTPASKYRCTSTFGIKILRRPGSLRSTLRRTRRRTLSSQTPSSVALFFTSRVSHARIVVACMNSSFTRQHHTTRRDSFGVSVRGGHPSQRNFLHSYASLPRHMRRDCMGARLG